MDPKDKLFKSKKMSSHPGPPSQLVAIDKPLLHYVFEQHEQGIIINTFNEKSFTVRCVAVNRWICAHLMVYRMGTQTFQCPPTKVAGEAADYMVYMHRMVDGSNRNRRLS